MHEMSIAQSIVDLAEEQARNRGSLAVEELELEIGRLAGVELQTLAFLGKRSERVYARTGNYCTPYY